MGQVKGFRGAKRGKGFTRRGLEGEFCRSVFCMLSVAEGVVMKYEFW